VLDSVTLHFIPASVAGGNQRGQSLLSTQDEPVNQNYPTADSRSHHLGRGDEWKITSDQISVTGNRVRAQK